MTGTLVAATEAILVHAIGMREWPTQAVIRTRLLHLSTVHLSLTLRLIRGLGQAVVTWQRPQPVTTSAILGLLLHTHLLVLQQVSGMSLMMLRQGRRMCLCLGLIRRQALYVPLIYALPFTIGGIPALNKG